MIPLLERASFLSTTMTATSLAQATIVTNPSTSDFLSLFRPDIDAGLLRVPVRSGTDEFTILSVTNGGTVPGLRQTLEEIVAGVDKVTSNSRNIVELASTGGNWTANRMTRGSDAELLDKSGRILSIYINKTDTLIVCGHTANDAEATIAARIDHPSQKVSAMSYGLELGRRGVEGIRRYLGLPRATDTEIACEVARLLYQSELYSPEEAGWPPRKRVYTQDRWEALSKDDEGFSLPHEHRNDELFVGSQNTAGASTGWYGDVGAYEIKSVPLFYLSNSVTGFEIYANFPARPSGTFPLKHIMKDLWIAALTAIR